METKTPKQTTSDIAGNILDAIKQSNNASVAPKQFSNDNFITRKPMISIVAICPNDNFEEYEKFERWLPNHPDVEIIVVANCVTDNETQTIQSREGNTTIALHTVREFAFDTCRNKAKTLARGEWILSIDIDERLLTPIEDVLNYLAKVPVQVDGLKLLMVSQYVDSPNPERKVKAWNSLKLFRNKEYVKWLGRVDEKVGYTISSAIQTDIVVQHFGYCENDEYFYNRVMRNFTLAHKELSEPRTEKTYENAIDFMIRTCGLLSKYRKLEPF